MPKALAVGKLPNHLLKTMLADLPPAGRDLLIPPGIGIDSAGLSIHGNLVASTTDPITLTSHRMGRYVVEINVNDIACMGCIPKWFSSVILLPVGTSEDQVRHLWQEMNSTLKKFGITAIGGHCEVTMAVNTPVVVGHLLGEAANNRLLDPREIQSGDKILLCRSVAIEGTALLAAERYDALSRVIAPALLDKMRGFLEDPGLCIWPIAKQLFDVPGLVALHDPTEGGVVTALHELADVSGCGLSIHGDSISVLPETLQLASVLNFDPLGLLASGSLLIVCRPEAEAEILGKLSDEISVIGEFTENPSRTFVRYNQKESLPRYDQDEIIEALKLSFE